MADAQRTIDLIFNGVDKTGAATLSALSNTEKFATSLTAITAPIADVTVGAVKLEAGLLAAGAAITSFAVKVAGDFDTAFREIATLLDKPIEDLGTFRQAILDYAQGSTAPLDQLTKAIYNAISAGVPLEESLRAVAEAEKLAVAGKADLNDTLLVLVSSLNAYGLEMDQAGRFSDALFTAVRLGQTTLPELANSLSQVTGSASALGIPFETLLAAISTLTSAGAPTEQAITRINAVLTSLLKPSKEASDLAAQLGIEFGTQSVQAKGLEGVLADVARVTGGNQEQMALLFGSAEALKAVFPLTGASAQKFADDLVAMGNSAGATEAAFQKMAESVGLNTQKLQNALTNLLVAIGTPLLDEFGGVAKAIAGIFAAITENVRTGGLADLVTYIEGLFGDLQTTIETVAKNLPAALEKADFGGFKAGIDAVVGAFAKLFDNIDLTTVDGLTRAIELAGAAFLGLSKFTAGVIESFKPLFDLLVNVAGQIDTVNPGFVEFAGNIGGAVTQFNLLLGGINGLIPALEVLVGLMVANQGLSLVGAVKALTGLLPGFTVSLQAAGAAAAGVFAADQVVNLVQALLQWKAAQEQLTAAQQAAQNVQELANDTLTRFAQTTGIAVSSIDEASKLVDDGVVVWDEATNTWIKASDAMTRAGDAAVDTIDPFGKQNQALLDAAEASEKFAGGAEAAAAAQQDVKTYTMQVVPVLDEVTGKIVGYEQRLVATAGAGRALETSTESLGGTLRTSGDVMDLLNRKTDLTNDQLITLAKNVKDAEIALEQIASNERIKFIEARVALDIAELEAGTERVKAAFDSINASIETYSGNVRSAFGALGDVGGFYGLEQLEIISDQLEIENRRIDEAAVLQRELTQAQIEVLRAQARSYENGDALIQIDGAGLQPHLEAFMWEILKAIQVRVNNDGYRFLLGV